MKVEYLKIVYYVFSCKLYCIVFNIFLKEIYLWKKIVMLLKLKLFIK